jgi:hypothetical protein
MTGDTGELGFVLGMGYYYNATYNSLIESSLANTQFIHGAFNYSATSGSARGMYMVTRFSGTSSGGECIRARSQITAATTSAVRGVSVDARAMSGGSCTGIVTGIHSQLATETGCTVGGTWNCFHAESNFVSAALTPGNAAFLYVTDYTAYPMPFFLSLGMAAAATGAVKSGTCSTFTNGGLKVRLSDGSTGYIPIGTTCA